MPGIKMSYSQTGIASEQRYYYYFVYKMKEQYGYTFDKLQDPSKLTRVWVDSFLKQRAFYAEFSVQNTNRVDSSYDPVTNVILEKYAPPKTNEYSFDSLYFYYSPLMSRDDFSLSGGNQDSTGKGKLFQVRLLYNPYFSKLNDVMMPKREFHFKFERYKQFDSTPMIEFLDKFKGS